RFAANRPLTIESDNKNSGNQRFKNLSVLDILGQGGVGRVYLAYDETIGRRVAVKEMLDELSGDSELDHSFLHEAKITGKLEHPGIVPVYELGQRNDGRPYYVMRYIKGETLARKFEKISDIDPKTGFNQRIQLLDILIDVCNTLAYAHAKGVIHRDLKPANIIAGNFGETIVVDWGLAQVLDDDDNTYFYREALTHQRDSLSDSSTSEALGTPAYMAPEQFGGYADKTSDVYSLGMILYKIITGTQPYRGSISAVQQQIEKDSSTPSPKRFNTAAPPELIAICEKAVHKNPLQRFTDAGKLAEELKAFRDGRMVNVYAYSRRELLSRFFAQNKFAVFLTALLLIAVTIGAGFSLHYAHQMHEAKHEAEQALSRITFYGERSQQQARSIVYALQSKIELVFSDLSQAAEKFGAGDINKSSILEELQNRYPNFEPFAIRPASETAGAFTASDEIDDLKPIADFENNRLILKYRIPIEKNGRIVEYLEARMLPEKVLPKLFTAILKQDEIQPDIWIMRSDGLILYDANSDYIGTNLFIDPISRQSPSLQAFGRLTMVDDDSIGYYSYREDGTEIFKIAAWDSLEFNAKHDWKIIVDYTYLRKEMRNKFRLF
ncbi:MAG: protein kinase, partial [Methylomicrobium sp.]|nr:protein kinase [Methylomicrobium sp.]